MEKMKRAGTQVDNEGRLSQGSLSGKPEGELSGITVNAKLF